MANSLKQINDYSYQNTNTVLFNDKLKKVIFPPSKAVFKTNALEYQYSEEKNIPLGQIFTPATLAKFMAKLIESNLKEKSRILDPCIGPNTFFNNFSEKISSCELVGIEIDQNLISPEIQKFYSERERKLIIDSFFNYDFNEKFDFIIQNPPYIRQELMNEGDNSKLNIISNIQELKSLIPSKSNLYVYFLLKSIIHLKENGKMVAVIYDSWLFSSFGRFIKKMLLELGELSSIYHFKNNAFPDAEVGATVIEFVKRRTPPLSKVTNYYCLSSLKDIDSETGTISSIPDKIESSKFFDHNFNGNSIIDFDLDFLKKIEKISNQPIQRGISSIANKFFIHPKKEFQESTPFIKDVSLVTKYKVRNELHYFLSINGKISTELKKYLGEVKKQILSDKLKYKALKKKIKQKSDWNKIKIKEPGNVIFNYYLRNNVDFLYNPKLHFASDNFYILNIEEKKLATLAVLNSSFTRLAVLRNSRNQGNGLRKIQLYEFKNVPILNMKFLRAKTVEKLEKLGVELEKTNRYCDKKKSIIRKIDDLLISEYNNLHSENKISNTAVQLELAQYFGNN